MNMTGNTILITGGTSGIGRALAEALYARGNTVIIAGRRQELLDEVTRRCPGMVGLVLDVTDKHAIEQVAADVRQRFAQLNVLINNAGISRLEDYRAEHIESGTADDLVLANVMSVTRVTAALLPLLNAQPQATLIATSSGLAFTPMAGAPTYSASKAFVHAWLEALRVQLRGTGTEVLELVPPYVRTALGGEQQANDPYAMPLEDFVAEVMSILEEGRTEHGEILVENVKPTRYAERDGQYDQALTDLAAY